MLKFAICASVSVVVCCPPAEAKNCSPFERQVYAIAKKVRGFQKSDDFANYGWSIGGPFNDDMKRIQSLQNDNESALKLMGEHEFAPMDIYNVANQYRTHHGLDGFYAKIERSITTLKCR